VINTDVAGYSETGAAGGNIMFPSLSRDSVNGFFGGEASALLGSVRAIFRLTYNTDDGYDTQNASVSLINANNAMGTQSIVLPGLGQAHLAPSLTLTGTGKEVNWWVNYGAKIGIDAGVQHHIAGGLKLAL
jgi:hypothetical protein